MHTIFNDKATMLPYLPMLCPMSVEAMAARRKRHRAEVQEEKGLFLDIILIRTGELLGTTGFRSMNKVGGTAEWGVIISKNWHRKGICAECFVATLSHAAKSHGIHTVTAVTRHDNIPMLTFFEKRGMAVSAMPLATPVAIAEAAAPKITPVTLHNSVVPAIAKSAKANPNASILAMLKAGVGVTINNGVVNPMDPAAAQRALKRHQQVNSTRAASAPLPATIAKASQPLAPEPKKSNAARAPTTVASRGREPPLEVEPEPDAIENESGGSSAGAGAGAGAGGGLGSITLPTTIADDGVSTLSMLSLSSAPATQTRTDGASSLEWLSFEAHIADVLKHH